MPVRQRPPLALTVLSLLLVAVASQAGQAEYNARIVVRVAEPVVVAESESEPEFAPEPDPWAELSGRAMPPRATVAGESRILLQASRRRLLSVKPAQVATGGHLFVYAKLPGELVSVRPPVEVLLRQGSEWRRHRVLRPGEETVGSIGFTLVVPELEPGPILAALAVRSAGGESAALVSEPFEVPPGARLRLGFGLDEWDWRGLAPVTVSVVASVQSFGGGGGEEWEVMRRRLDPAGQVPAWFDEDIDLDSFAGDRIALSFRSRVDVTAGLLAPQVVWSRPTVVYRDQTKGLPPSFALLLADSLRAESLGCCGSQRNTSPYLDKLFGKEGLVFDHALTQAADTRASTMSLFTATYPSAHGVLSPRRMLARGAFTLAEAMSEAGYATAAFCEGGELAAELGFDRGFDVYYQAPEVDPWNTEGRSAALLTRMLEWLERHAGEPRLAFFHSYDIGWPYLPDAAHVGLFGEKRLDRGSRTDHAALVRYEREVRGFDDTMRDFVGRLDKVTDPSRLLLVLSSAHGEEFGEHGALGHGSHLYDETVRVPLMLRGLGLRAGSRYRGTIGHIDLAPTILEFAGLAVAPSMAGTAVGRALRSGLPFTVPERISEAHGTRRLKDDGGRDQAWRPPWFAVAHNDHKVIVGRTSKGALVAEAYDLMADPDETSNLFTAPAVPAWAVEMRGRLEAWAKGVWESGPDAAPEVEPPFASRIKLEVLRR